MAVATDMMSVRYELTALGRSLAEPIAALRDWAERNINEIERAHAAPE